MKKKDIGYYIKTISKFLEKNKEKDLKNLDLTSQQFNILVYLNRHKNEEIIQKQLETVFECSNATMSGVLKRLESKEYIYREALENDSRSKKIYLTQKGIEIDTFLKNEIQKCEQQILKGFSEEEKELLLNLLTRVKNNVKEGDLND